MGKSKTSPKAKKISQLNTNSPLPNDNANLESRYQDNNCDETNISFGLVTIVAHNKVLFQDTPLNITYGHRYGLIGKNGIGKSSLLNQLATRQIPIHPNMDIYYMEQDIVPTDDTVLNTVLKSNKKRQKLLEEFEQLSKNDLDEVSQKRYEDVSTQLNQMETDKDESIVIKILLGLGFTKSQISDSTKLLSGGWRMRVALAKALYLKPILLLLDEPTNHLDINATLWLTNYLSSWENSLVIVSHNQHFLNEVCTDIINVEDKRLVTYRGNYHKFKHQYQQNYKKMVKDWDNLQKLIKSKRKKGQFTNKDLQELLAKEKEKGVIQPFKPYQVKITFPEVEELPRPVLESHEVSFHYTSDSPIIEKMDIGIDMETRMTIVGANGNGKTTIMNLLIGLLEPISGVIKHQNGLRIGYYNQHFVSTLPTDITPVKHLIDLSNGELTEMEARKYLGTIGLEGYAHKVLIENLSGGQKARVTLASIQFQEPHILFLDEPTNHLDIETIDALIDAINNFNGGVVVISHDMELITRTNCELWTCQDKKLNKFPGDYDDYVSEIIEEIEE